MLIAIDASRAFVGKRTGTENYSYQLIKALAKIDSKSNYLIYLRPDVKIEDKWPNNFKFHVLNYKRFWTQIGLAQQTFKDKIDILFIPAHTLPIIRKTGLKTVVTVHDLGSEYLPKMHQLKQRSYLSFIQKVQLKGVTHLIAVSNATKNDLVKKIGIDPKKITVIYEGYDKQIFKQMKNDILVDSLKYYNLQPKGYFLFVGTIQPRKNLERIIWAFSKLKRSFNLVIIGKKGWLSDEIYVLPSRLNIEKKVKFLDYVPSKYLPSIYSGAAALIFPSLFEGFGLPILEAQACGCPVLTSNLSSMPEVAGKAAIFVDPLKIDDIVKGMKKMQDVRYRSQLTKKGLENVKRFSWEKCARETLDLLEKIANK